MGHKSTEKYNDICALKHNMLHYVMGETEKGFEDDPVKVHVLGEYIDMIKDLAEAEKECQEACYYESVVDAMDSDGYDDGPMGYNRKRNRFGQYSDGRGMSDGESNRRMGYIPDMNRPYKRMMDETDWDEDEPTYGKSFNRFRKAKRHYTKTHSEEDKQKMKDASNAHMMETMATLREIWDDADPDLRKRMKTDLTNLTASLT
jgi:hypothetical protein